MELREAIAREMFAVVDETTAWDKRLQQFQRDIWLSTADRILSLPEIKEGEQLRRLCYLHDGPGGVSVQMREK